MRVGREHGLRVVAKPSGDDVHGDAVGQRQGRGRVAQDVKRSRLDPGCLAVAPEPFGEPLGMDRAAELVRENEVPVLVGATCKLAL